VAGLPRSGSTLLCNLLLQNPKFHATGTSPLCEMLISSRNQMDNLADYRAMPEKNRIAIKMNVMRGIASHYYDDVERDIVFDKCRAWPAYIETLEDVLDRKVKILVTVRDLRDVLTSLEMLWRKNKGKMPITQETANLYQFQTLEGRCNVYCQNNQLVGVAVNQIKDAVTRGFRDRMEFVDFKTLTEVPSKAMKNIYGFLDEPEFQHNYDQVDQIVQEDDYAYNFPGLHTIRNKVEKVKSQWREVLGEKLGMAYAPEALFWKKFDSGEDD
jgi:sulfotransferase